MSNAFARKTMLGVALAALLTAAPSWAGDKVFQFDGAIDGDHFFGVPLAILRSGDLKTDLRSLQIEDENLSNAILFAADACSTRRESISQSVAVKPYKGFQLDTELPPGDRREASAQHLAETALDVGQLTALKTITSQMNRNLDGVFNGDIPFYGARYTTICKTFLDAEGQALDAIAGAHISTEQAERMKVLVYDWKASSTSGTGRSTGRTATISDRIQEIRDETNAACSKSFYGKSEDDFYRIQMELHDVRLAADDDLHLATIARRCWAVNASEGVDLVNLRRARVAQAMVNARVKLAESQVEDSERYDPKSSNSGATNAVIWGGPQSVGQRAAK